jgi:hypothetical protein
MLCIFQRILAVEAIVVVLSMNAPSADVANASRLPLPYPGDSDR